MTTGRHYNGKYCVCCNKLLFKLFHIVVNCCCMSPAAGETQLLIGITGSTVVFTHYIYSYFLVRSAHHSFCKGLIMMTMIVIINRPYQLLLIV